jgi:hypothetical protein
MEQAYQPAERSQPQTKVIQKRGNIGISAPLADLSIFPASALVMVVAKLGSFPNAAASSFSVSSAAGDEPTSAARADFTKQ